MSSKRSISPWIWVPTLYFAEGIPYFIVNSISTVMFKKLGMGNAEMAFYTSLLYLPWVIKPIWSPFVDIFKNKRWWITTMQLLITALFLGLTLSVPVPEASQIAGGNVPVSLFTLSIIIFWVTSFASATNDIATDGYYMLALKEKEQSLFVGIRSTFFRFSNLFVQGALVALAGIFETRTDIPTSWRLTLGVATVLFGILAVFHLFAIPRPEADKGAIAEGERPSARRIFREFGQSFATFFKKPIAWVTIVFLLLFRLPEALTLKIVPAFLLDSVDKGGMALTTVQYGVVNNTVGVIGLLLGGILGGVVISRGGLRKWLWPMAAALALPCVVYLWMALNQSVSLYAIGACVLVEQFGYGFGFTAFMLYMIFASDGPFKTSHYALCTGFMAASMMLPGMVAGAIQEYIGYAGFFQLVMVWCTATAAAVLAVRDRIPENFGTK